MACLRYDSPHLCAVKHVDCGGAQQGGRASQEAPGSGGGGDEGMNKRKHLLLACLLLHCKGLCWCHAIFMLHACRRTIACMHAAAVIQPPGLSYGCMIVFGHGHSYVIVTLAFTDVTTSISSAAKPQSSQTPPFTRPRPGSTALPGYRPILKRLHNITHSCHGQR
eukprot:359844-Chlamydomonas_euryale.AAC.2